MRWRIVTLVLVVVAVSGTWVFLNQVTPVEELLSEDAAIDMAQYNSSEAGENGTEVLVLGSTHLAQADHGYTQDEFYRVNAELAGFDPDMVVVEYLPPDWPEGEGRDYRPGFNKTIYAADWDMAMEDTQDIIADPDADACRRGKAYFLERDHVNAGLYWKDVDCPAVDRHDEIVDWLGNEFYQHELAVVGYPVAEANDVSELTSFDYQGDDAEWFIPYEALDELRSGRIDAFFHYRQLLPVIGQSDREFTNRMDRHGDSWNELLHFANSPELIGLQYWAYEENLRSIERNDAGDRQVDNYWLRNERMFATMDDAVEAEDPDRVLVIVGMGHKYFLDELAYGSEDYIWIDPREYLPSKDETDR